MILFKTEITDTLHEDIHIFMCLVFMMEAYCNPYELQTDG